MLQVHHSRRRKRSRRSNRGHRFHDTCNFEVWSGITFICFVITMVLNFVVND